jgi:hypothetical protein
MGECISDIILITRNMENPKLDAGTDHKVNSGNEDGVISRQGMKGVKHVESVTVIC